MIDILRRDAVCSGSAYTCQQPKPRFIGKLRLRATRD